MINKNKLKNNLLWTYSAFTLFGISLLFINITVGYVWGLETLGGLNQVYVIYILISQISNLGTWSALVRYIPKYKFDQEKIKIIADTAFILSLVLALVVVSLFYIVLMFANLPFVSDYVWQSLVFIIPGIILYSFNKTLLGIFNGLESMRIYSIAQMLRYGSMIGYVYFAVVNGIGSKHLMLLFVIPEVLVACYLIYHYLAKFSFIKVFKITWCKKLIHFGTRNLLSLSVNEMNTRIDILVMAFFLNDTMIGLYSLAASCAEGLMLFIAPIRENINPIITSLFETQKMEKLTEFLGTVRNKTYYYLTGIGIISITLFYFAMQNLYVPETSYMMSMIFLILVAGMVISSGYIPMNMLLSQLGHPLLNTSYRMLFIISNIVLNILLIPKFSVYGAAFALGISYLISALFLKVVVYRKVELRI